MTTAAWERFVALVLAEDDLQRRLGAIDDWDAFVREALRLAEERDVSLRVGDLEEARRAARRSWGERWSVA